MDNNYIIYSDGAYSPSIDQGGVGFVVLKGEEKIFSFNKMFSHTTNQRMEMLAAIIALESLKNASHVTIVTDSMYLVGTMTKNWKRKANLDLWERFDKAIAKHLSVNFTWVKGHDKNKYNEEADKLAFNASKQLNN
jgi:ribonuclease HI